MWLERSVVEYKETHNKISTVQKINLRKPLVLLMTSLRRRFIREVDKLAAANPTIAQLQRSSWSERQTDIYNCFYKHRKHDQQVTRYLCNLLL